MGGHGVRGLASPHPFLGATWGVVRALLSLWFHDVGRDRALSPWLVLVCLLPYVTLLAHCALCVRLRLCRQGLRCLSVVLLLGCIAVRWCTDTSMWARIVLVSPMVVFSAMLGSTVALGDDFLELFEFSAMLGSTVALGDDFLELFEFSAMLGSTVALGDDFVAMVRIQRNAWFDSGSGR